LIDAHRLLSPLLHCGKPRVGRGLVRLGLRVGGRGTDCAEKCRDQKLPSVHGLPR